MFGLVSLASPQKRVARGARWLDENKPGWAMTVDPDRLDLGSATSCVLAQVYGDSYYRTPPIRELSGRARLCWSVKYGFNNRSFLDLIVLEQEWKRVLEVRRGAETLAS